MSKKKFKCPECGKRHDSKDQKKANKAEILAAAKQAYGSYAQTALTEGIAVRKFRAACRWFKAIGHTL